MECPECEHVMLSKVLVTSLEWNNRVNLRAVDALGTLDDSPVHLGEHMHRKTNLTGEIPA